MRVPVKIPVGGRIITVVWDERCVDDDGTELAGYTAPSMNKIHMSRTGNPDARAVFRTLFHELTHIALDITGHSEWLDKLEEPIVYAIENMIAELFVFNPAIKGIKWREVEFAFEDE